MRRSTREPESARGWMIRIAAVAALLLVALAAAVQGRPRFKLPGFLSGSIGAGEEVLPENTPAPSATPPPTLEPVEPNPLVQQVVQLIGLALALVLVLAVLYGIYRWLRGRWYDREFRRREGAQVATAIGQVAAEEPIPDAPTLQRGLASALETIDRGAPSDAIIAAWLGLEQTAGQAGIQRGNTETAGEFAVRIITRHEDVRADAQSLLGLFESVRFGGITASETDREAARVALQQIEQVWR